MDNYREIMETIHLPKRVEERVMASVKSLPQRSSSGAAALRRVVCAACALALVLGSVSLRWEKVPSGSEDGTGSVSQSGGLMVSYEFGIAAGAVERAANGGLVFRWEDGNCGFRVVGEEIADITLETNRGVLVRNGEIISSRITECYASETVYGLAPCDGEDLKALDGVELVLTVKFTDGTEQTKVYHLTTEKLRRFTNENGEEVLIPALTGDPEPNIEALYMSGDSSRWLLWPVADSNTVSLSMPYGRKSSMDGTTSFHAGIDIPGQQGVEIVAAAAGIVLETGYDTRLGNYLVLDHGDDLTTLYGQCQELLIVEGERAEAGQQIALLGTTGMSTGPHLHFEVRQRGEAQNPVAYFDRSLRDTLQTK